MLSRHSNAGGWSPYLAGALLGVLAVASAWLTTAALDKTHYLGASTTFVRAAGLVEKRLAPAHVAQNEYFSKTEVGVDWQFMLVLGIFVGALGSSLTDRSFKLESIPPIWRERFGNSIGKRAGGALGGGIIAMIGVRLASGCPSGHGLSGMMQMAVSGLVALVMFFTIGALVANILYREHNK